MIDVDKANNNDNTKASKWQLVFTVGESDSVICCLHCVYKDISINLALNVAVI